VNLGNDERLVDMTVSDLRALLLDAVRDVMEQQPTGKTGELLTTEELAKLIKVSPDTARKWRRLGCPHVAVGERKFRWRLEEVLRWREELQHG
jgi:Helix-turn-helix domain